MASRAATVAALGEQVARMHRSFTTMRQQMTANRATSIDGVEWAAYGLLFRLVDNGPMRSSALAEVVCVDPSTVSRQVAQLVKAGLVERRSDPEDGRASLLVATDRGRTAYATKREQRQQMFAQVLAGWSAGDLATLTELLTRFNDTIAEGREALAHHHQAHGEAPTTTETIEEIA